MRHATAKFGLLVHRFGMMLVGLHARDFIFRNWTPKIGGILRGAPAHLHKSEATVIENNPLFPTTERVLAQSPATLRESCSPEMTKKAKAVLSGGQDRPLTISFPAQSMPAWSTSGGDCGSIMMPGEASNDCTVICGS